MVSPLALGVMPVPVPRKKYFFPMDMRENVDILSGPGHDSTITVSEVSTAWRLPPIGLDVYLPRARHPSTTVSDMLRNALRQAVAGTLATSPTGAALAGLKHNVPLSELASVHRLILGFHLRARVSTQEEVLYPGQHAQAVERFTPRDGSGNAFVRLADGRGWVKIKA